MPTTKTVPKSPVVTVAEFRAAVRFMLVNEHGMPELVADEVLENDAKYVQDSFQENGENRSSVADVANELAIKPSKNREWVKVDAGQMVLTVDSRVEELLTNLMSTGLDGDSLADVAATLLCRGIETVLPVLPLATPVMRR